MRDYKQLLASFIEVVTFLLAAFGGFLKNIAPPDPVQGSFAVGAFSFLTLILLMIISAVSRSRMTPTTRKWWIVTGMICLLIAAPSIFMYRSMLGLYTYPQSQELSKRQLSAPDRYLTQDAARHKEANPAVTAEQLLRDLPDGDVWTQAGIEHTRTRLLALYACLVLSISAAVFCLLEANMRASEGEPAQMMNKST